jgi:hypothetical protein
MPQVYCQVWEESERGWGVRPDGYSLHLTLDDVKSHIAEYWKKQKKHSPEVPDEYSRPCGEPYLTEVNRAIHQQVKDSKNGVRTFDRHCPEPVGNKS